MREWHTLVYCVAPVPGEVIEIQWQGDDLLLYRTTAGEYRAITAYCPHMGNYIPNGLAPDQSLSELLQQNELRCPYHGWRFNGEGRCTHIPQGQHVPVVVKQGRAVARHWRVREENGRIQIAAT